MGNLLGCADEAALESVVVLHEISKFSRPHPFALGGGFSGLLHGLAEPVHRFHIGVLDDIAQDLLGFGLGLASDDESIETKPYGRPPSAAAIARISSICVFHPRTSCRS